MDKQDKQKILDKIKKCLALSESANEHEAALALKHAQALMREHNVSIADVELSAIHQNSIKCAQSLPIWQHGLIMLCARAFGADAYKHTSSKGDRVVFYGIDSRAELASYAYEVLLRQLRKARREYMRTLLRYVRNPRNKTYRADEFCKGWVIAVRQKVQDFALGEQEQTLMRQYEKQLGKMESSKPRQVKASGISKAQAQVDRWQGEVAGRKAQLNHGVGGAPEPKRIAA